MTCSRLVRGAAFALVLVAGRPVEAAEPAAGDAASFDGVWIGWVVDGRGENPDRGHIRLELTILDGKIAARELGGQRNGQSLGEGTFTLARGDDQATIDATRTSQPAAGRTHLGIYVLEGDVLRWCVAQPNKPRPEDFETRRGQFLMVLKKQ